MVKEEEKQISKNWLEGLKIQHYRIFPNRVQLYSEDDYVYFVEPDREFGKIRSGQWGSIPLTAQELYVLKQIWKEVYGD